jgi:hypothetical protein
MKYIKKSQLRKLPEYAQKYFNQKIVTNKTIKLSPAKKHHKKDKVSKKDFF